jgi:hypothetical protein
MSEESYWLCCGSRSPSHSDRACLEAQSGHPERCRFGTASEHSAWQSMRGSPAPHCRTQEIHLTDEQRKLLTVTRDVSIPGTPGDASLPPVVEGG